VSFYYIALIAYVSYIALTGSRNSRLNSINIVTCCGVRVTDIVNSGSDWLDLLGVSITILRGYNSSHIELLLDNESLTVVWILH
jgi:hypothetical protein